MAKRDEQGEPMVAAVFSGYPDDVRGVLHALRRLILDVAARTPGVGPLSETLKWGQPSYLTVESGSGSTVRIDRVKNGGRACAIYFHCQTDLVETFRRLYPERLHFEGDRAILLDAAEPLPTTELAHCVALALTYHARKNGTAPTLRCAKAAASG